MRHKTQKTGFTLVEILVVVTIIAILVGLLFPAINAIRRNANMAVDKIEISQLEMALKEFKLKTGDYPPDFANLNRAQAMQEVMRFIRKTWPRIGWIKEDGTRASGLPIDFQGTELPVKYNSSNALVFWLGGYCHAEYDINDKRWICEFLGFSANPQNPFDVDDNGNYLPLTKPTPSYKGKLVSISRWNAFFKFPNNRITGSTINGFSFWPKTDLLMNYSLSNGGYIYLKPPYDNKLLAMQDGHIPSFPYLNKDGFQLRSCGRDGLFYPGTKLGLIEIGVSQIADDLGNCWDGTIEDNFR